MKKEINGRRTRDQASVRTDSRTSAPFAAVETDKTQYLGDINKEEQAPRRIVIAADEFTGRKAAAKSQEQCIGIRLQWRQQPKCNAQRFRFPSNRRTRRLLGGCAYSGTKKPKKEGALPRAGNGLVAFQFESVAAVRTP
jgi:hypothetical protein